MSKRLPKPGTKQGPPFTQDGYTILKNGTDYKGEIVATKWGSTVNLVNGPDDKQAAQNLLRRMRNWYSYKVTYNPLEGSRQTKNPILKSQNK